MFLRFERQRFSGGDGRPEFLPVVPVFDFENDPSDFR